MDKQLLIDHVLELNAKLAYNWCAQDSNGKWWAYKAKPVFKEFFWCCTSNSSALFLSKSNVPVDASKTLIEVKR